MGDFKAYLVYFDAVGYGNASDTLALLEDDANLTDSNILTTNFRTSITGLVSSKLNADSIFPRLFQVLLNNNGKGIGAGELALPLILRDYRFATTSDGVFGINNKVELKKNGASLKPVKTGLTEKGLIDKLNDKYWHGTVPGAIRTSSFNKHLAMVNDPADYGNYFKELYVGCDTTKLAEEVILVYRDPLKFNTALGKFALAEYKRIDGWHNIMYLDSDTDTVVNIVDPANIDHLSLKFKPMMRRGKDTQAIADGYVNVKI